jgi:hypothetical protein
MLRRMRKSRQGEWVRCSAGLWTTALVAAACGRLAGCDAAADPVVLVDLKGREHLPQVVPEGMVHVVVITSHECPIANAYVPTLQRLALAWSDEPVELFIVHVGTDSSEEVVRKHTEEYGMPGHVLRDPAHRLAAALGIGRTPEAVVLKPEGPVYRGRIDDQWRDLGARAPAASQHDLRDAVDQALSGKPVQRPFPPAVGCLLPEPTGG